MKHCSKCKSILFGVVGETPDMSKDELKKFNKYMKDNNLVYGPWDKKYYCHVCNKYYK